MVFDIFFLCLLMSFIVHILVILFYFINKSKTLFILFLATAFTNIFLGCIMTVLVFKNPSRVKDLHFDMILWVISGFLMFIMLSIKVHIIRRILKRKNDPAMYHINYFGKKVYEQDVVMKKELAALMITIPFFLIFGAYFIAKLKALIP